MNEQNNNSNGRVKSKFFNQDLYDAADVNDIGAPTSGQVISWGVGGNKNTNNNVSDFNAIDSNQMLNLVNSQTTDNVSYNQVSISNEPIGVFDPTQFSKSMDGQAAFNNNFNQTGYATSVDEIFAQDKFNDAPSVNPISNEFVEENPTFTGYNANPEITSQNNNQMSFDSNMSIPPSFQETPSNDTSMQTNGDNSPTTTENTIVVPTFDPFNSMAEPAKAYTPEVQQPVQNNEFTPSAQLQQNSPLFAMAAESQMQNEVQPDPEVPTFNNENNTNIMDENMHSNQPLSLMALSGESTDETQKTKEVEEKSKYFQKVQLEDNRLKAPETPISLTPASDILSEPPRDIESKELVKSFIGEKYKKISMAPFSFCGALFGPLYFFYRKMFLHGFVLSLINLVLSILLFKSWAIGLGLLLGEFIIVGLMTNNIYLSFAENEVTKIAMTNSKKNQYELQKICKSKGGTNLFIAILANIAINAVSTSVLAIIVGSNAISNLFGGANQNILQSDRTANIEEVIEYTLPTEFVKNDSSNVPYHISETIKKKGQETTISACGFNINLVSGYKTSEDLVRNMADRDQRYNKVSTYKTPSGEKWDVYSYKYGDYTQIYRAKDINNHIVLITYLIHEDSTEGMCEKHLENIMTSIKEK